MTDSPPISLVCLDLASIVIDGSIVERAFAEAIATQGIVAGTQDYARSMVRFDRSHGRAARRRAARPVRRRRAAGAGGVAGLRPLVPRGGAAVRPRPSRRRRRRDRQGGRRRAPGSACSPMLSRRRLRRAPRGCAPGIADLVLCADDAPRGFPWPDPVLTAMLRLGTADVREVAVVSATADGVLSGYRAGARIVVGSAAAAGRGTPRGGRHPCARQHRPRCPI